MKSNWNYPTTIWAGENRFNEILNACSLLKFKNPLFVTLNPPKNFMPKKEKIIKINSSSSIPIYMAPGGGFAIHIIKI